MSLGSASSQRNWSIAARMDRLPVTWKVFGPIIVGLGLAFLFESADLQELGYAATGMIQYMHVTTQTIAFITSSGFFGMFIGAVLAGYLADRMGRRRVLLFSVLFYSVFSLLNGLAPSVGIIVITRLLTGVGVSALASVGITYVAELFPKKLRGRYQSLILAIGLLGISIISWFARFVVPTGPSGWRWVFIFGAIGGLVFLLLYPKIPESPRWLARTGKADDADAIVSKMEADSRAVGATFSEEESPSAPEPLSAGRIHIFSKEYRGRTIILWLIWIFQTLGFYGFLAWVPTILLKEGNSILTSLSWSSIISLGFVPGALAAWLITDNIRMGRKFPIGIISILIAVLGLLYGTSGPHAGVRVMVFGFGVAFFLQFFVPLVYSYTAELYPTGFRNQGMGWAYGVGRLANVLGPLIVAAVLTQWGTAMVFVYLAVIWLGVCVSSLFGPKTAGKSLETLNVEA